MNELLEVAVDKVEFDPPEEGYRPTRLMTNRGAVACRYYPVPGARRAAVWVGGAGGGWDTPAAGLYPRLCREFADEGVASLRVRFRYATELQEALFDVLAGIAFLEGEGVENLALTGHSFGGAVVIQAGALMKGVRAVVALATQSYGAQPAARLGPRAALLLIHGREDEILPDRCSRSTYDMAREPKRLILYDGAGHVLDEAAADVYREVKEWIAAHLP